MSRRTAAKTAIASLALPFATPFAPRPAWADGTLEADEDLDYLMDILSKDGAKAYRQYWPALQLAADFYAFEMEPLIQQPEKWAKFEDLFRESGARGGQGQPSQLEREFINPMRMMTVTFPEPDTMQTALQAFSKDMRQLQKGASGYSAGDVPSPAAQKEMYGAFDNGRKHLNAFFVAMNDATGTQRMVGIPDPISKYPRSKARYLELKRNMAKCKNRGGEALAGVWGQLMVYGTTGISPCGEINLGNYFSQ
mmetsp:Transcript_43523/g.136526  ORF Transcript_43523/g.136526 Transcript_43523/m.136526 type:complete len:252 (-) Transcript_43523:159-914(-)